MNINLINPLVLAYIGDAVYELEIRKRLVENKINKVNELQKECTKYVSARGQASYMEKLINSSLLNEDELDIYKRVRNSKVNSHPSNTDIITYKVATGFEALIGYLYFLNDMDKINKIIDYIMGD
jgi:ribonuclease-3 family protein